MLPQPVRLSNAFYYWIIYICLFQSALAARVSTTRCRQTESAALPDNAAVQCASASIAAGLPAAVGQITLDLGAVADEVWCVTPRSLP
jgi:hypothetical protein